jgi:transglutaminase-like putative cysteine protease
MMLRPWLTPTQHVADFELKITPTPVLLHFVMDDFGNEVAVAQFDASASELSFESAATLTHAFSGASVRYETQVRDSRVGRLLSQPYLAPIKSDYQQSIPENCEDAVHDWICACTALATGADLLSVFTAATQSIYRDFTYALRLEEGRQSPLETLASRRGCCRDFAVLMMAAARRLGCAARFCSGYSFDVQGPSQRPHGGGGHTHAWASIFLYDHGWVAFDPTHGLVGDAGLVLVAMTSHPSDASPLSGAYFGKAEDFVRLDVDVEVRAEGQPERWVA